jgi:hypothetical protein
MFSIAAVAILIEMPNIIIPSFLKAFSEIFAA